MLDISSPTEICSALRHTIAALDAASDCVTSTTRQLAILGTHADPLDRRLGHELTKLRTALHDAAQRTRQDVDRTGTSATRRALAIAEADSHAAMAIDSADPLTAVT